MKKITRFVLWITCLCLSLSGNVCLAQRAAGTKGTTDFQQSTILELKNIGVMIGKGETQDRYLAVWKQLVSKSKNMDVNRAINLVIAEAKQEINRNVNKHRSKVQKYDEIKRNISQEINANRAILSRSGGKIQPIQKNIYFIKRGNPDTFNVQKGSVINTAGELANYIKYLENQLNSVGDDQQMASANLTNMLQQQQASLTALTNMQKALHDTAMAILNNEK
jgi:hypothetical protein